MPTDVCEMKEFQREKARGGAERQGKKNSQSVILRWREMFGFLLHLHGGGTRTMDEADFYIVNVLECNPPAEECCIRIKT